MLFCTCCFCTEWWCHCLFLFLTCFPSSCCSTSFWCFPLLSVKAMMKFSRSCRCLTLVSNLFPHPPWCLHSLSGSIILPFDYYGLHQAYSQCWCQAVLKLKLIDFCWVWVNICRCYSINFPKPPFSICLVSLELILSKLKLLCYCSQ